MSRGISGRFKEKGFNHRKSRGFHFIPTFELLEFGTLRIELCFLSQPLPPLTVLPGFALYSLYF
jgi:hypothetical protein